MKTKSKSHVIEVKEAPLLSMPDILQGIRDAESARRWGEKNGYLTIYFLKSRQRVYADKIHIHDNKSKGAELVGFSEAGNTLAEFAFVIVFFLSIYLAGRSLGWLW